MNIIGAIHPTATPAPEWKAGDRAMVVIIESVPDSDWLRIKRSGGGWVALHASALHPLPALSVEDAAVLAFAHDVNRALSRPNADIPHFGGNADLAMTWQRFITAVRARPARSAPAQEAGVVPHPTQQTPEIAAARDVVVEAGRAAFEKWNGPPAHVPFDEMVELGHRLDTLNALLTPPEPPDPVAELREAILWAANRLEVDGNDGQRLRDAFDDALAAMERR